MIETQTYTINIGPQHPSTHGGLHVEAIMDGEVVKDAIVHVGYVHRSVEKIAESRTYAQFVPYASRLDYLASHLPTLGYVQAVEKLAGITVPERAEYIRIILAELSRIASHMIFVGSLAIDLGATTGLVYCFRDRERIMDMFEMSSGQRLIASYMRIGGVAADLPEEFYPAVESFLNDLPGMIAEYHGLLSGNEILQQLQGVGILPAEDSVAYGVTGPNLRASGVDYDLRRDEPYGIYSRFDFKVPVGQNGDSWDRFMVRIEEMEQSGRIIKQALKDMPSGRSWPKCRESSNPRKAVRCITASSPPKASWASIWSAMAVTGLTACIYAPVVYQSDGASADLQRRHTAGRHHQYRHP